MLLLTRLAHFLYGIFRCTPFAIAFIAALLCVSCSSTPRTFRVTYSAPSSAKVGEKISVAQSAIARAVAVHAKNATAKVVQLETLTAATPELHDLATGAHADIDALTNELSNAQVALSAAETARAELQVRVETQTDQLNTATTEKNEALRLEDIDKQKTARALKQRNRFAFLSAALLVWIFRKQLLALGGSLFKLARLACGIPV